MGTGPSTLKRCQIGCRERESCRKSAGDAMKGERKWARGTRHLLLPQIHTWHSNLITIYWPASNGAAEQQKHARWQQALQEGLNVEFQPLKIRSDIISTMQGGLMGEIPCLEEWNGRGQAKWGVNEWINTVYWRWWMYHLLSIHTHICS